MSVPDVAVAGALLTIERSATRWALVVAVDELLPVLVSSVALVAVTVAVLAMGPVLVESMCTTMVKVWVALGASVPKLQVTVPAVVVHPALAETKLTWAGSTSVTVPPLEAEGGRSDAWRAEAWQVRVAAVAGAVLAIERSATRWALVVAVDELLPVLVSCAGLEAATVAVLAIGPVVFGWICTTIDLHSFPTRRSSDLLQVTVPAVVVQPALAETKLTWAGSTSVTVPPLEV